MLCSFLNPFSVISLRYSLKSLRFCRGNNYDLRCELHHRNSNICLLEEFCLFVLGQTSLLLLKGNIIIVLLVVNYFSKISSRFYSKHLSQKRFSSRIIAKFSHFIVLIWHLCETIPNEPACWMRIINDFFVFVLDTPLCKFSIWKSNLCFYSMRLPR